MTQNNSKTLKEKLAFFIATYAKSGLLPKAPGTWGSLMTLPLGWILLITADGQLPALIAAILISFFVGAWATGIVMKNTPHDPGFIVIDEVAGQLISLLPLPFFISYGTPKLSVFGLFLAAFLLFRFFDIVKVWPACYFDKKVLNKWGVMTDDVVAGFYAALVLTGLLMIINQYASFILL